jgi:hypothetical protein
LEIDEHAQHKDVYEHTLTVVRNAIALEDEDRTSSYGWRRSCTTWASRPPSRSAPAGG